MDGKYGQMYGCGVLKTGYYTHTMWPSSGKGDRKIVTNAEQQLGNIRIFPQHIKNYEHVVCLLQLYFDGADFDD